MIHFTRSPIDRMPTTSCPFCPFITGRWRIRCSVMRAIHSSKVFVRVTYTTGLVMISFTWVFFDGRPLRMTLRAHLSAASPCFIPNFGNPRDDYGTSANNSCIFCRRNDTQKVHMRWTRCFPTTQVEGSGRRNAELRADHG